MKPAVSISIRSPRSRLLIALLGLALLVVAVLAWRWWGNSQVTAAAPSPAASQAEQPAAAALASSGPRGPDALRAFLLQGALKGIKVVGTWCVTPPDGLKPCEQLRDRFEYYLAAAGAVNPQELRSLVEDDAKRANGVAVGDQLVVVYDRYLAVRDYAFQKPLDLNNLDLWSAALDERHQVRWQGMGAEWAQAFFGQEERTAQTALARARAGQVAATANNTPAPRPNGLAKPGQVAPGNGLDKASLEQMRVNQKIDDVREEWMRLDGNKALTDQERAAQLKRFVAQHVDPKDQERVMFFARLRKP